MKVGEIRPISEDLASKHNQLKNFSYMQCLGQYFEFTLLLSILDYFLANNKDEKIKLLVNPCQPYSKQSQIIADQIERCILQEKKISKFYEQVFIKDNQFIISKGFLNEYCKIYQKPLDEYFLNQIKTVSNIFQLSIQIFGNYDIKVGNQQKPILIYIQNNQYYYIKQFNENQKSQIYLKKCQSCNQAIQNDNENKKFQAQYCKICIRNQKSFVQEVQYEDKTIANKHLYSNDYIIKKRIKDEQIDNQYVKENTQDDYSNEFMDKQKLCSSCSKSELLDKQFINLCQHTFCRDCCIKFAISVNPKIKCPYLYCGRVISTEQLNEYIKLENILFQCSNCQSKLKKENLFLNRKCSHFLCFNCSYELIVNKNYNQIDSYCPIKDCNKVLDYIIFNEYFEQYQNLILQEQETQQQQEKIIQSNQQNLSYKNSEAYEEQNKNNLQQPFARQNDESKMEIYENEEENKQYQSYGECTLCHANFSVYNIRQQLNCQKHQVGVCCILENLICPQCQIRNYNFSKDSNKPKLQLSKADQVFDVDCLYTDRQTSQNQRYEGGL